jgi:hypothetical protein
MNYSRTDFQPPARSGGSGVEGAGLSIFADIFYTPRNVDLRMVLSKSDYRIERVVIATF